MYYNNINGYTSKKESLEEIVKTVQPDLIALCETKLGEKEEVDIEGYETLAHNVKKGQEGLAIAARIGTYTDMESVSSEESNIFTVKIEYPDKTIRAIVCHGPQEDDKQEIRSTFFEKLAVEVERCYDSGDIPIILGDLMLRYLMMQTTMRQCVQVMENFC